MVRRFLRLSVGALLLASVAAASSGGATQAGGRSVGEPASAKFAFHRGYPWAGGAIWTVGSDGKGLQQVTRPPEGTGDHQPAWSPDRRRIAFYRLVPAGEDWRGDTVYRSDLMVMNADGSALRRLLPGSSAGHPAYREPPAWSPDGTWLALPTYARTERIAKIRADGSGLRTVVTGPDADNPVWSPTGREIAFNQWIAQDERTWYFVVSANGGRPRLLIPSLTSGDTYWPLAWSPNGRKIAFFSQASTLDGPTWLHVANRDGSGLRKLVAVSGADGQRPRWSPDGSELLVERGGNDVHGPDSAYVVNPASGQMRRVARNTDGARWSPDGRSIAFVRRGDLYVVKASGGSARLVVRGVGVGGDFDW